MAKKKEQAESTVYIGRTIRGLTQYTVFPMGVTPPHIAHIMAEREEVRGLVVPLSRLQDARRMMLEKGTILNKFYMQL